MIMDKKRILFLFVCAAMAAMSITAHFMRKRAEKNTYQAGMIEPVEERKMGFYEKYVKRVMDVVCATGAIVVFSPLFIGFLSHGF